MKWFESGEAPLAGPETADAREKRPPSLARQRACGREEGDEEEGPPEGRKGPQSHGSHPMVRMDLRGVD